MMPDWSYDWGSGLRRLRQDAGLSQRRLAEKAGLSQQHLSLIEQGRLQPELRTVRRLAGVLGFELVVSMRPTVPEPERRLQWRKFKEWEERQAPATPERALSQAEALAKLFIDLHGLPAEEPPEKRARTLAARRLRMKGIP